jgi:hypothetical protein
MATNNGNQGGIGGYLKGQSPAEAAKRAEAARLTRAAVKGMAPKGTKTNKIAAGAAEAKKVDRVAEYTEAASTGTAPNDLFGHMSDLITKLSNAADEHHDNADEDTRALLDSHVHPLLGNAYAHIADAENVARGGKGTNWKTGGGAKLGLYGALHLGDAEIPGQALSGNDVAEIKNQRLRTPGDHLNMAAKAIGMAAHHLRLIAGQSGGDFTNNYRNQNRTYGDAANEIVGHMRRKEGSGKGIGDVINETNRAPFGTRELFPNGEDHASHARERYERSLEAQAYTEAKTPPRTIGMVRSSATVTPVAGMSPVIKQAALQHFDANNPVPVRPTPRDFGGSTRYGTLELAFPSPDHQARYEEAVNKFDNAGSFTEYASGNQNLVQRSAAQSHAFARAEVEKNPAEYLKKNNINVPGAQSPREQDTSVPVMAPVGYDKKNTARDLEELKKQRQDEAFATYAPNIRATQQREGKSSWGSLREMTRAQIFANQQAKNTQATDERTAKYAPGVKSQMQNMYDHFTAVKKSYRDLVGQGVDVDPSVAQHLNNALGAFQEHSRYLKSNDSADPQILAGHMRTAMDRTTDAAKYLAKAGSESSHVQDLAHLGAGSDLVGKYRETLQTMAGVGIPRVNATVLR